LRDQLIAEIHKLSDSESLTLWAHRRLSAKNTLTSEAAPAVEATYQAILAQSHSAIEVVEPQPFSEHSGLKPELTANNPADVGRLFRTNPILNLPQPETRRRFQFKERPQTQQGPFGVRREPALSGLPGHSLRCPSS
jgi:hypothetical protein